LAIRELREQVGLTQAELGQALNITPTTISRYETGERGIDAETAKLMADFFDVSLDDIYDYHPTNTPTKKGALATGNTIIQKLLEKSIESFLMAIEVYNKPTIHYRVEGFSLFICNAWELLLKARMIDTFGENSIYYKDNPNRTLSLENCISKVFTNQKAPLRRNLEKIIELRNISTHFITEEYEMVYVPLFQSCVFNYTEKIQDFFCIDMSRRVPQNFLTLTVSMRPLDIEEVRAKYPAALADKLIQANLDIQKESVTANNAAFAIRIEHYHYLTKDKNQAASALRFDQNAKTNGVVIKEVQDVSNAYSYNAKRCIDQINRKLAKDGFNIQINNYHFLLFVKYYGIKSNPKLCYCYRIQKQPLYSYSMATIDLIVSEIEKDAENILRVLKEKVQKKKETPGAKDSKH